MSRHRGTGRFDTSIYNGKVVNFREAYVSWLRRKWGYSLSDLKAIILVDTDNKKHVFSDFDSMTEKLIELQKQYSNHRFEIIPVVNTEED